MKAKEILRPNRRGFLASEGAIDAPRNTAIARKPVVGFFVVVCDGLTGEQAEITQQGYRGWARHFHQSQTRVAA